MARRSKSAMIQSADILLRENGYEVIPENKCHCTYHKKGSPILAVANFYDTSDVSIFRNSRYGKIPICKACINEIYTNYYTSSQDAKWSLFKVCEKLDIPFFNSIYEGALKEGKNDWQKTFGLYMKTYNSFKSKNNWQYNFDNSESIDDTAEELEDKKQVEADKLKLTTKEKQARKDIVDAIGRDPFENQSMIDRKVLYLDLVEYLDEETQSNPFLIGQIIQTLINNNTVSKLNDTLSTLTKNVEDLNKNQDKIRNMTNIIKTLSAVTTSIAKENGIAKKDGDKKKRSTLTGMMTYYRELGLDDIEEDFYNQKVCYGMQISSDISMKSIFEQDLFDDSAYEQILVESRKLVKKLEREVLDLEEENRILYKKIDELEKDK